MLGRTGLWLSSFLLCAAVTANDLIDADTALMGGDYGAAVKILQEHADGGNVAAMVRLANLYHRGEGVAQDTEKAVALYLAAAETGNAEAQFNLGNMYLLGEGLPQDEDWALTFYRLAAKQGHRMAERNMRELARANGIEIGGTDAAPVKPPGSDAMDLIDTPVVAPLERPVAPIALPAESDSAPSDRAIAARPSETEGDKETGRVEAPIQDNPPVAAGIAASPIEAEPAVEIARSDDSETQPSTAGEIYLPELEQVSVAPLPAELTAPAPDPIDETEDGLASSTVAGLVVARAATAAEIAAAAAAQEAAVESDDEIDGGVVVSDDATLTAEIERSPTPAVAEPSVAGITTGPDEDTAGSATTPMVALEPIDAEIERPFSEGPADEAKALRLAQDHGIAVQLDSGSQSPPEVETSADANLPPEAHAAESLSMADRFERAQRAVNLQNFEHARESLQALASDGYAPAALVLADMAERGSGMGGADSVLAMRWLERAAVLGSPEAQYQVAERHLNGHGLDPDEAMAITFYRDAARGGHEMAQEKLRVIFAEAGLPMPDFTDKPNPKTSTPHVPAPTEHPTPAEDTLSLTPDVVSDPADEPSDSVVADELLADVTSASDDAPLPVLSKPLIVEEAAPAVSLKGSATELLQPTTRISKPDFAVEGPAPDMVLKIDDAAVESEPEQGDPAASSVSSPEIVATQIQRDTAAAVESPEPNDLKLVATPAVELLDEHVDESNAERSSTARAVAAEDQPTPSPEVPSVEASAPQAALAEPALATTVDEPDRDVGATEMRAEATPDPLAADPDQLSAEVVNERTAAALSADEAEALRLAQQHGIDVQLAGDSTPIDGSSGDAKFPTVTSDVDPNTAALAERYEGAQRMLRLENFEHGVNRLTELANEGYAPAASLLADMAERGEGMAVDVEQALSWRQEAARLGSPEAQYQLAEMHMHGTTVEPDEAMAITYYRDAARGGHESAKEKLRLIYADAGLPMPDFSRPRQPIAIYAPANGNGSDTSASAASTIADANVEAGAKMDDAKPPTPPTDSMVAKASVTPEAAAPTLLASDPEPIREAEATTVVADLDEGSSELVTTNSDRDAIKVSPPLAVEDREPREAVTAQASTAENLSNATTSSDDSLTELIVPELVGEGSITAYADEAETETSPAAALLAVPEAAAPSVAATAPDVVPAVIDPPVAAAGATVAATAALGSNVATQSRKGFFGRLKGMFSRDKADVSKAVDNGQHLSVTASEPIIAPDVAVTETEAETMTDNEVQLAAVDPLPVPNLDPSETEADDAVDIEPAATTPADPVETDLETRSVQDPKNTETPEVADAGTSPPTVTIDDGKRALADRQFANAIEIFTELANEGNAEAQAHLGYMYYKGEGVDVDLGLAVDWYERAAVLGNRDAQYNLAVAYAFGEGVPQDDVQAVTWYRRAAEQGSAIAQYSLGVSYALGEGVERDDAQAVSWYRAAAEQGYAAAQYNLGYGYRTGNGVEADDTEALRWFLAAAQNGHAAAQYSLGYMYRSGRGVERDLNEAIKWYRLAADQGHPDARADLASLNPGDS